jgi:hypothetical protein
VRLVLAQRGNDVHVGLVREQVDTALGDPARAECIRVMSGGSRSTLRGEAQIR